MKEILLVLMLVLSLIIAGCSKEEKLDGTVEINTSIAQREESIGKSDKDFTDITKSKARDINNDVTGKWRKTTLSESVNLNEYILSYNKLFMDKETTVHWIINFANKTTTRVIDSGDYIEATTYEYVEKEEHDAKKIGSGMKLGEYRIYKDNGDIEEVGD